MPFRRNSKAKRKRRSIARATIHYISKRLRSLQLNESPYTSIFVKRDLRSSKNGIAIKPSEFPMDAASFITVSKDEKENDEIYTDFILQLEAQEEDLAYT